MKDNQKVTKVKAKTADKDLLNSTTRTKTKPDVASDELIAKVTAISHFFLVRYLKIDNLLLVVNTLI